MDIALFSVRVHYTFRYVQDLLEFTVELNSEQGTIPLRFQRHNDIYNCFINKTKQIFLEMDFIRITEAEFKALLSNLLTVSRDRFGYEHGVDPQEGGGGGGESDESVRKREDGRKAAAK